MATHVLISSVTVSTTTAFASVNFTSIPQTYNDLRVLVSARSDRSAADGLERMYLYLNGDSTSIKTINWTGNSSTSNFDFYGFPAIGLTSNTNAAANQFGITDLYISEYTQSNAKIGIDIAYMPLGAGGTLNYNYFQCYSHPNTSPITSITTGGLGSNWLAGSTFYLYGIKNS